MSALVLTSPAKLNLFLAVTGRRADGFHDLVSLVAPLAFGDTLTVRRAGRVGGVELECDDPAVPTGAENLAVRAALAFRAAAGVGEGIAIVLNKRIPMGAGLGGGSGNAATVLRALNRLHGDVLERPRLAALAAELGSDCPLFLEDGPCLLRGRGERIERLPETVRARIRGARVLVFKPDFGIATPWAYARLVAADGALYEDAAAAEARLARWVAGGARLAEVLFNTFERVAFAKFLALPALAEELRTLPGVAGVLLSGSGSACFALLDPDARSDPPMARIRDALGTGAFVVETTLA